jgi:hypothetical protein
LDPHVAFALDPHVAFAFDPTSPLFPLTSALPPLTQLFLLVAFTPTPTFETLKRGGYDDDEDGDDDDNDDGGGGGDGDWSFGCRVWN